jgi:hypothetical protein
MFLLSNKQNSRQIEKFSELRCSTIARQMLRVPFERSKCGMVHGYNRLAMVKDTFYHKYF